MEHRASCIRNPDRANPTSQPRIEFKPEWFDIAAGGTPEGIKPDVGRDGYKA